MEGAIWLFRGLAREGSGCVYLPKNENSQLNQTQTKNKTLQVSLVSMLVVSLESFRGIPSNSRLCSCKLRLKLQESNSSNQLYLKTFGLKVWNWDYQATWF